MIGAAAAPAAARQLGAEQGPVAPLMDEEIAKLADHLGRPPAREPDLGAVDADRAMFAGMIDLHHPVAERFSRLEAGGQFHRPTLTGYRSAWQGDSPLRSLCFRQLSTRSRRYLRPSAAAKRA